MKTLRARVGIVALSLPLLLLTGCGGGLFGIDMTGLWSLVYTNTANNNAQASIEYNLTQTGTSISGFGSILGFVCGNVSGSVSGSTVSMTLVVSSDCGSGSFTTTGTVSGGSFSGSYTANAGGRGPVSGVRVSSLMARNHDLGAAQLARREIE